MQPSVKKTVWFAGVSKANWLKCQQYFWEYFPLFPTCILHWQPAQMFCFPEDKENRQMHISCLARYSHSEHIYTPYGECLYFLSWTDTKIIPFEKEVSKILMYKFVMYTKQSRAEMRIERQPFLPHQPPPKILCPSDQAKFLPDHSSALSLSLNMWGTCSPRQPFFLVLEEA